MLLRRPVLSAQMNLRLMQRAASYLLENRDLLHIKDLIDPDAGFPLGGGVGEGGRTLVVTSEGSPRFSYSLGRQGRGNLGAPQMAALVGGGQDAGGQTVIVFDDAALSRLKADFEEDPGQDVFFVAARALWQSWRDGLIALRPAVPEDELLRAIAPEDALLRFGPRFGLRPRAGGGAGRS